MNAVDELMSENDEFLYLSLVPCTVMFAVPVTPLLPPCVHLLNIPCAIWCICVCLCPAFYVRVRRKS